ncbi:MAG: discoidin domain-containing protein [Verrucomicrobiota bacterium]
MKKLITPFLVLALVSVGFIQVASAQMQLTTEIPPEQIEGTPMPIKAPNLLPALKKAPTLSVPENTALLSKGKPVTGSDDFPIIGELAYITDGDKEGGEGYFVELIDGVQWVQIDLEETKELYGIWVWHFHSQARAYYDVIVQVSDDPEFKTGVTTLFNNDVDDSAKQGKGSDQPYVENRYGKLIDAKGTKARYVRLYSAGNTSNDMNHYIEVEVYGK